MGIEWTKGLCVSTSIALAFCLQATSSAAQRADRFRPQAPGIIVSFEGGVVGNNLAVVLTEAFKNNVGILTETYTVGPGEDSVCAILNARGYPPPCTNLQWVIDRLNPALRPVRTGFRGGETVLMPAIQLVTYRAVDNYSRDVAREAQRADTLRGTYSDLGVEVTETTAGQIKVVYQAYKVFIPTKNDAAASALYVRIAGKTLNIRADLLVSQPQEVRPFSNPSVEDLRTYCLDGTISGRTFRYEALSDVEEDAINAVKSNIQEPQEVIVHIIDVPLHSAPNLYPAYSSTPPTGGWHCQWENTFNAALHHSTHLASIIASQNDTFGFLGLARNAKIKPFIWGVPSPDGLKILKASASTPDDLATYINDNAQEGDFPLHVYLAALEFDRYKPNRPVSDLLSEKKLRFSRALEQGIQKRAPLFIVAAGQAESNGSPIALEPTSNISPQSLGDLKNVIVVTACQACGRSTAALMPTAYWSRKGELAVHVAAPGGSSIPGWLSTQHIGAAYGTSQAAAYVTGIAAAMIGQFPQIYSKPELVKTRIQVTSRPLSPDAEGEEHRDNFKIAAGIVDPILALLDPRKHWIRDGSGWHEVKIREIRSGPDEGIFFFPPLGQTEYIVGKNVLRILKMANERWSAYFNAYARDMRNKEIGSVGRIDLVTIKNNSALTLCDGTAIALNSLDDFIPSLRGVRQDDCQSE